VVARKVISLHTLMIINVKLITWYSVENVQLSLGFTNTKQNRFNFIAEESKEFVEIYNIRGDAECAIFLNLLLITLDIIDILAHEF
jgi:hypothetical protein